MANKNHRWLLKIETIDSIDSTIDSFAALLKTTIRLDHHCKFIACTCYCAQYQLSLILNNAIMPVETRELIEAIGVIANERNVRVAVKQSGKGALVCAATAFVGGVLLGPVGLAIGGTAGGLAAYKMTSGTYRPLGEVLLHDLTDEQRERLVNHVRNAVAEIEPADIALLLPLILSNVSIQQAVLRTAVTFVSNELQLQIID